MAGSAALHGNIRTTTTQQESGRYIAVGHSFKETTDIFCWMMLLDKEESLVCIRQVVGLDDLSFFSPRVDPKETETLQWRKRGKLVNANRHVWYLVIVYRGILCYLLWYKATHKYPSTSLSTDQYIVPRCKNETALENNKLIMHEKLYSSRCWWIISV